MREISIKVKMQVIRLFFTGLSYDQISLETGVSKGAVVNIIDDYREGRLTLTGNMTECIDELRRVLRLKIGLPEEIINDYIDLLRQDAIEAGELIHLSLDINDEDDIKIISEAISGGATLFVTGDKELLNIETVQQMVIVPPRGFWELLKS